MPDLVATCGVNAFFVKSRRNLDNIWRQTDLASADTRRNAGALAANSVWPPAPREGFSPGGLAAVDPAPAEEGHARGRMGLLFWFL